MSEKMFPDRTHQICNRVRSINFKRQAMILTVLWKHFYSYAPYDGASFSALLPFHLCLTFHFHHVLVPDFDQPAATLVPNDGLDPLNPLALPLSFPFFSSPAQFCPYLADLSSEQSLKEETNFSRTRKCGCTCPFRKVETFKSSLKI